MTNEPTAKPLIGIGLMICAVACFPVMQSCVKALIVNHQMSFIQATWGRYFFHLLLVPLIFPGTLRALRDAGHLNIQLMRGVMLFLGTCCAFLALAFLPVAQVTALSFVAPAMVTVMAALYLHETVGMRRWTAVILGIVGVLIVIRPGTEFSWPLVLPLLMAAFYSVYQILTRLVGASATPAVSLVFTALVGAACSSALVPWWWVSPSISGWLLLAGSALAGGLGHWLMIQAYARTQASIIAPFAYTELIWAVALGFTLFGDVPDSATWIGAAIIVISGLYAGRSS